MVASGHKLSRIVASHLAVIQLPQQRLLGAAPLGRKSMHLRLAVNKEGNMDDAFACFLEEFGPSFDKTEVTDETLNFYKNKLPSKLLKYWKMHGWCGYADGLFWTVNPSLNEAVLSNWLKGTKFSKTDNYHVIAISAFGDLFLWGETTGDSLTISSPVAHCSSRTPRFLGDRIDIGVQNFFASLTRDGLDISNTFQHALKKLGRLNDGELYGFVPALALGVPSTINHLEKSTL